MRGLACSALWLTMLLASPNAWGQAEQAPAPTFKPLITLPSKVPPIVTQYHGKDVAQSNVVSFGNGGYTVDFVPAADFPAEVKVGLMSCTQGVTTLQFDPRKTYRGVLNGCPEGSAISIELK